MATPVLVRLGPVAEEDRELARRLVAKDVTALPELAARWVTPTVTQDAAAAWPLPRQAEAAQTVLAALATRDAAFGRFLDGLAGRPGASARNRQRTAVHEAGHAVVASHLGLPFRHVTIKGDEESAGHLGLTVPDRPSPAMAADLLVLYMGGLVAEHLTFGAGHEAGASGDVEQAVRLAQDPLGVRGGPALSKCLSDAAERARQILAPRRAHLDAVAGALSAGRRLTPADVRALSGK